MRSLLIGCTMLAFGSCAAFAQQDPAMPGAPDAPAMAAPADGGQMMMKKPMGHRSMAMHHKKKMMHHRKMMMHHKRMMHKSM